MEKDKKIKELTSRKGVNILTKMILLLLIPMLIFLLFANISVRDVVKVTSAKL